MEQTTDQYASKMNYDGGPDVVRRSSPIDKMMLENKAIIELLNISVTNLRDRLVPVASSDQFSRERDDEAKEPRAGSSPLVNSLYDQRYGVQNAIRIVDEINSSLEV